MKDFLMIFETLANVTDYNGSPRIQVGDHIIHTYYHDCIEPGVWRIQVWSAIDDHSYKKPIQCTISKKFDSRFYTFSNKEVFKVGLNYLLYQIF